MRARWLCVTLASCLFLFAAALAGAPGGHSSAAAPGFSADAYLEYIKYLADDKLAGRLPGTPGIELAAEYIAEQFKAAGLEPGAADHTYYQSLEVRRGKKLDDASARLEVAGVDRPWEVRKDWVPLPFTELGDVEGPLAFAGFGIQADAYDYNDYADFDADGKLLLIFRYEPRSADPDADFGGREASDYGRFDRKARSAARHGARALLIVNPPQREDADDTLLPFDEDAARRTYDLPMIQVSRELAAAVLKQAGWPDPETLQTRLERDRRPLSGDLKLRVTLKTGVRPNMLPTRNVVGLLRGTGDTPETIILGAHYDHLGQRPPRAGHDDEAPVIYNGADDNASGTAALLELARVLGHEHNLRRNVVFVAFTAEEMGLLGSQYFANHPTVPLGDVRAMINFDMVGRLNLDRYTVFGTPSAKEFPDLVRAAAERAGLVCRLAGGLADNSDHAPFLAARIPTLFPFTGVHKQYHRPDDDWQTIDAEGATRVLAMFHDIIGTLGNLERGPEFQEVTGELDPDDLLVKPEAEHENEAPAKGAGAGRSTAGRPAHVPVQLGITPDPAPGGGAGVVATVVIDGGAAQAAGLRDGDRITRIGDRAIKDVHDYMAALQAADSAQTLDVAVVRGGQSMTFKVKLPDGSRRRGGN